MIRQLAASVFERTEAESRAYQAQHPGLDGKVLLVCITVAFSLTMNYYLGDAGFMVKSLRTLNLPDLSEALEAFTFAGPDARLHRLLYWVCVLTVFYLAVPIALIKLVFREPVSAYGLRVGGAFRDYKLYLVMLGLMLPVILFVSGTESFQERYPFYGVSKGSALYPNFFIWEAFYLLQFFGLEFFFRGFMLHGLKLRFGYYAVMAMTIPYCMIHFGKPLPETLAAIAAGLILGTLSLKSGSIWPGVAIHYGVAIAMDLSSLWRKGIFGN